MSYDILTIDSFDKQLKRLVRKYPSLKFEFTELVVALKTDPKKGTSIGHECYKIRLAVASKGKGKSGGARIITYVAVSETTVFLLSIYDKSEQENISDKELIRLLNIIK
ncbi:MAG TPA: hypothetical protein DIT07_08360 [Sphingobacteriaceae bacterium]|nr:hypothetical protein [Sphingobacteriaceae bacterium]